MRRLKSIIVIKLAVIGANAPSIPFYKQAKALGYSIIGIAWAEGAVCKQYCDKFYPISFKEKDEVLKFEINDTLYNFKVLAIEASDLI